MLRQWNLFFLCLWFVLVGAAPAAEVDVSTNTKKIAEKDEELANEETLEAQFIEGNIVISEFFDEMADGLDTFLMGKRITLRKNETSLRAQNNTLSLDGEGTHNSTSIGLNLRLPNVEEYWMLKFSSYDDSQERRGVQNGYLRNTPREQNYGATVGVFRKLGNINTSFQPRIDLGDPLKISHSLTFESIADLKTYSINPKLELYANPNEGAGIYFSLNINFRLTKIYDFTLINNGDYKDKKHLLSTANGFSVGQIIDRRTSMAYSLIFNGLNQPHQFLDSYDLSIAWSQLIYRKIFDYQVIPYLNFAKEKEFRGRPGVIVNLNLNF
ncbi:MAG: hypothetical protein JNL11_15440 [Bdellovibrionaceae bacterium]|nr:hypothetical protein [Pseudobdellovibrionaceae bacterium]